MNISVSPRTIRVMFLAAAALVVAGVVAAATTGGSDTDLDASGTTVTTRSTPSLPTGDTPETVPVDGATTIPGDGSTTSTVAGQPTTTAVTGAAGSTGTSIPAPTTPVPGGQADGELSPTAAGTYRYATSGTTSVGTNQRSLPPETTLTVGEVDNEGRQIHVRDLRDADGNGTVTRTTFRYAPDGVYLEQIELETQVSQGFGQTNVLVAAAPYLIIPADATAGTVTTGRLQGDGIVADITFTVVDAAADTTDATLVADLSGSVTGRQTTELTARTADRLTVYEKVHSDLDANGLKVTSDYEATLKP